MYFTDKPEPVMAVKATENPDSVLPLRPADFHILMVLLEGELHGYGIMQAVVEQSSGAVQLEVGSLYRLIARMTEGGLVAESGQARDDSDRRRYYRITTFGREVAQAEARRLEEVVRTARAHDLLTDKHA